MPDWNAAHDNEPVKAKGTEGGGAKGGELCASGTTGMVNAKTAKASKAIISRRAFPGIAIFPGNFDFTLSVLELVDHEKWHARDLADADFFCKL